ncbi:hypothetical protein BKA57DRAFT_469949 [Linnemannia elongata]|nr:hypothetical protein BKA57DRAFT_469949 [Linnemannia elongata]
MLASLFLVVFSLPSIDCRLRVFVHRLSAWMVWILPKSSHIRPDTFPCVCAFTHPLLTHGMVIELYLTPVIASLSLFASSPTGNIRKNFRDSTQRKKKQ